MKKKILLAALGVCLVQIPVFASNHNVFDVHARHLALEISAVTGGHIALNINSYGYK